MLTSHCIAWHTLYPPHAMPTTRHAHYTPRNPTPNTCCTPADAVEIQCRHRSRWRAIPRAPAPPARELTLPARELTLPAVRDRRPHHWHHPRHHHLQPGQPQPSDRPRGRTAAKAGVWRCRRCGSELSGDGADVSAWQRQRRRRRPCWRWQWHHATQPTHTHSGGVARPPDGTVAGAGRRVGACGARWLGLALGLGPALGL